MLTPLLKHRLIKSFLFFLLAILLLPSRLDKCADNAIETGKQFSFTVPVFPAQNTRATTPIDTNRLKQSDWYSKIMRDIELSEYEINWHDEQENYQAPNREHNLRSFFDGKLLTMQPREEDEKWKLELQLKGVRGDSKQLYKPLATPAVDKKGGEITFNHNNAFSVQYINNKDGVRQNFIIEQAPASPVNKLSVRMSVNKGWHISQTHPGELQFAKRNGKKLEKKITYNSLKAWDANNRELAAKFIVNSSTNEIDISVDAVNAVYPVTIDPLSTTGDWIREINFTGSHFGTSVASAGDVNGDGFDDVVIGAPEYDFQQTDEGSIFVFHGSPTGLSNTINFRYEPEFFFAYFGVTVAGVGDVNNDGYDDVMAGAPNYSNGNTQEGRAYIFLGSGSGLSTLRMDWRELEPGIDNIYFGSVVAAAGDVNNDGCDDVIIGAPGFSNGAEINEGGVFLYHGSPSGLSANPQWQTEGGQNDSGMGAYGISTAGDVDGDGFDDVIVSTYLWDGGQTDEGKITVYRGSPTGLLNIPHWEKEGDQANLWFGGSIASAGDINGDGYDDILAGSVNNQYDKIHFYYGSAAGLTGAGGTVLGPSQSGFGGCVAGAGDVNNDGYDDILVTAHYYTNGENAEGAAFLYYGSDDGPSAVADWNYETNQALASVVLAAGAGDVNGDGFDDMIVGAPNYSNGQVEEGRALVFYGTFSGVILSPDQIVESNIAGAALGADVCGAGDVNGDGYSDVIISSLNFSNGENAEGKVFVYHGSATGLSTVAAWSAEGNQANAEFGKSVSLAGDVNRDGFGDVIIGAPGFDNGQTNEGRVFVYHGSPGGLGANAAWIEEIDQETVAFGFCVALAGDVNNDGYSDVIISASRLSNGQNDEGGVFVYHGSPAGLLPDPSWTGESDQTGCRYGQKIAGAGDVNGDGASDIIVAADYYDNGEGNEGVVFVYYGSGSGITNNGMWMAEGNQWLANFGSDVSSAGDVNGDGFSDVLVGALYFDDGESDEGSVFVYYGSASGLSTTSFWKAEGNRNGVAMGVSVTSCGDMNGDGYSDIAVGAAGYNNVTPGTSGVIFMYYGSATGLANSAAEIISSPVPHSFFGFELKGAGDINGDGYSDMIVGAPEYNNGQVIEGAVFIYYGEAQTIITQSQPVSPGLAGDEFGYSVASAGDVNGDGYDDVIVGAPLFASNNRGKAFLYYGQPAGLSASPVWSAEGTINSRFGLSVSTAGDVNGDGYADVIIGAPNASNGHSNEGRVYVYHGSPGGLSATGAQWTMESNAINAWFGSAVASAGDINADGYSDIIIGAPQYSGGQLLQGRVYVYQGGAGGVSLSPVWTAQGTLDSELFGTSVCSAGDVNGDGYSDIAIGVIKYYDVVAGEVGGAFVYHGSPTGLTSVPAWRGIGQHLDSGFGVSIASAGDVNGDGFSDLLVGAHYIYDDAIGGKAFVYHGSSSGLSTTVSWEATCSQLVSAFGDAICSAGDLNGDGYSDLAVGAYQYDLGQSDEGRVFIYHGSGNGLSATPNLEFDGDPWNVGTEPAFGLSVSSAGDINGDGYSDLLAGAPHYDLSSDNNEGGMFVYYGNNSRSNIHNDLDLYNTDLATPINQANKAVNRFGAGLFVKSTQGRTKARLVWETQKEGVGFNEAGGNITNNTVYTSRQATFTDIGIAGMELKTLVTKTGMRTKVRVRAEFDKATSLTGQVYGPWRYSADYQRGGTGMNAVPLPLRLLSFTGRLVNNQSELSWKTADEENTSRFEVQRSPDGRNFTTIGTVRAAGTGDHDYNYTDTYVFPEKAYYRLKMIDQDQSFSYSSIVVLKKSSMVSWEVYPNPVAKDGMVTIGINSVSSVPQARLQVVDMSGRVLMDKMQPLVKGYQTIEWKAIFGTGQYLIRLMNAGDLSGYKKIVVQ